MLTALLVRLAQQHQASLAQYLEPRGYDTVLQSFHVLLDALEEELARPGRVGVWLGGGPGPGIADLTLGLYLHRIWQLGLETEYFEEGVRPQLSVFYLTIRARPAFLRVTRWREEAGRRTVKSETDQLADSARLGLGAAAVLGGLFLVKKLLRK